MHDFNERLEYSELDFDTRKKIYEDRFSLRNVRFVNFDTDENKSLQRHDIDVMAEDVLGNPYKISEKIRERKYYGDILIEVYSNFKQRVKGWIPDSEADYLCLFYEDKYLSIKVSTLKAFCKAFFTKEVMSALNKEFEALISTRQKSKKLYIGGTYVMLSVAYNRNYETVNVCIKESFLRKHGVGITEF